MQTRIALVLVISLAASSLVACAWSNHRRYETAVAYAAPAPAPRDVPPARPLPPQARRGAAFRFEFQRLDGARYRGHGYAVEEEQPAGPTAAELHPGNASSGPDGVMARAAEAEGELDWWLRTQDPFATPAPDPSQVRETPPAQPVTPAPERDVFDNPPAIGDDVPILGRVVAFDADTGHLLISVGSELGVKTGQQFELIRGGRVLGTIKVVQPYSDQSVAVLLTRDADVLIDDTVRRIGREPAPQVAPPVAPVAPRPSDPVTNTPPPAQPAPVAPPPAVEPPAPAPTPVAPERVLRLQDLIDMATAGLGEATILAMVRASKVDIAVDSQTVIDLHRAGLSEAVIQEVINRAQSKD